MAIDLTLRSVKGTPLTHSELDGNFTRLKQEFTDLAAANSSVVIGGQPAKNIITAATMAVYPETFYQVADGSDDSASINRAIAYLQTIGGGTILYRSKIYNLYRAIRLDSYNPFTFTWNHANVLSNIRHVGAGKGATILRAKSFWTSIFSSFPEPFLAAGAKSELTTGRNISISEMTLDCDYDNVPDGGATYGANYQTFSGTWPNGTSDNATWAADNYQYPIYAWNTDDLTIENVEIKNSWFNGVEIYRCSNVRLENCDIRHCGDKASYLGKYSAVEWDNGTIGVLMTGCLVDECGNGVMSNGDPLPYARSAVKNVRINNNEFKNISGTGVYAFDWIDNWKVENNIFENIGKGGIEFLNGGGTNLERKPVNCSIDNNTIRNFNTTNTSGMVGIRVFGYGHSITSNKVYQFSDAVTNETYGIVVSSAGSDLTSNASRLCVVDGNTVSGKFPSVTNGSHISIQTDNSIVTDNICAASGSGSRQAIRVDANNVTVADNSFVGTFSVKPIVWVSGTNFHLDNGKSNPFLAITTTAGKGSLTSWNVIDFNGVANTKIDNRTNFVGASNAFVADIAGVYEFTGLVSFNGLGSNELTSALFERNGSVSFGAIQQRLTTNGSYTISAVLSLNAGDSMTMKCFAVTSTYSIEAGTSMTVKRLQA